MNQSLRTRGMSKKEDKSCAKTKRKIRVESKSDNQLIEPKTKISRQSEPMNRLNRLCVDFFANKTCIELSKALLGQTLCRSVTVDGQEVLLKGMIVETESYLGSEDKASATYNGRRTEFLEPLYMSCGTCFVYMTYGMYYCINVSAQGDGEAVLLRAVQPLVGIEYMQRFRAKSRKTNSDKPFELKMLANGPSKLCMSFDINKNNINKVDITNSDLIWVESADTIAQTDIVSAKRIGIGRAKEWADKLMRFYVKDNEFVSQK